MSLGVLIGVVATQIIPTLALHPRDLLLIGLSLAFIGFLKRTMIAIVLVFLAGALLGGYRGIITQQQLQPLQSLAGSYQTITGTIQDDTTRGSSGDQRIRLNQLTTDDVAIPGNIWVQTRDQTELKRGDIITASGQLTDGFGTIQVSMFRATIEEVVRPNPGDIARVARDSFAAQVDEYIATPQSNLGVSFLVGQRSNLPSDIQDMFRDLGLVHLVVASGFHLSIVIKFSRRTFSPLSKYLALLSSLLLIFSFLLLTGFSTSMVRAALVTSFSLLAWYVGRALHPLVLLPSVAAITALINPLYIWSDIAWYLSFAAFTGVIVLAPLLQKYFWHPDKDPGFFRYLIIATFSAQVLTFPIIAITFQQYSLLAIAANVLVLPIVPIVMLGTFITGVAGYLFPFIAAATGWVTELGLRYITTIVELLAGLPIATSAVNVTPVFTAVFYVGLLALMIYLQRVTGHSLRSENPVE